MLPISDSIYQSVDGYFMFRNDRWIFTPLEKEFTDNDLLDIAETLINLNEKQNNN